MDTPIPLGVGASSEAPTIPSRHTRPHWVRANLIDKAMRVSCMRCVTSVTVKINDRQVGLVLDELTSTEKQHWLCTSYQVPR